MYMQVVYERQGTADPGCRVRLRLGGSVLKMRVWSLCRSLRATAAQKKGQHKRGDKKGTRCFQCSRFVVAAGLTLLRAKPPTVPSPASFRPARDSGFGAETTERRWSKPDLDERRFYHVFPETVKTSVSLRIYPLLFPHSATIP